MDQRSLQFPRMTRHTATAAALLSLLLSTGAVAAVTSVAPSGITVRVHTPADLTPYLHAGEDGLVLRHPAVGEVELLTGPEDPRLPRRDVDVFIPLDATVVVEAVAGLHTLAVALELDVFLLPSPPVETLGSFARRGVILLSPAFGAADERTVAELTIHELGHVLTWAYFDHRPDLWDRYLDIRGLDRELNGPTAPHAQRAREILAEDIRFLFGGAMANWHGSIENGALATPDRVEGLAEFLSGVLDGAPASAPAAVCSAWPNPCNPQTTVAMAIPLDLAGADGVPTLRVMDLRGRLVRTVRDGVVRNGEAVAQWDGRDDAGSNASSGRYLYEMEWHGLVGRGAVTLVR